METDVCAMCEEELDVEHLLMLECGEILCSSCCGHHDCDICFPSDYYDSDSDYEPTEESSEEEESSDPDE